MRKLRTWIFIVINLLVLSALFQVIASVSIKDLNAQSAALTVTSVQSDSVYALKGQWEYFPGKLVNEIDGTTGELVTIEHLWPKNDQGVADGVATYRLSVSGLDPLTEYGVYIRDEASAYRLIINGKTVLMNGNVTKNPSMYRPDIKTENSSFRADSNGRAVFVIEIANYDRATGGFWNPVMIGLQNTVEAYDTHKSGVEVFILSTMITLSLFFLLLSSIDRENRSLYMAVFTASVAFRVFCTGVHLDYALFPQMTYMMVVRMEFFSGYVLLLIIGFLIESFRLIKPIKGLRFALFALIPITALFTSLVPISLLEASYSYFEMLVLIYIVYVIYLIMNGLRHRIEGALTLASSMVILSAGSLIYLFLPKYDYALYFASTISVMFLAMSVMINLDAIRSRKDVLETEVLTDHLTGAGNRAGLFKELVSLRPIPPDQQRYILFIDLNKFKQINDVYGHEVGDEVLIEAAKRFRKITRSSDLIYRYGGDEFVILADISESFSIEGLINRLQAGFKETFKIGDLDLQVSLAIGYERYDPDTMSPDEILKRSDKKMYEQKRQMEP